MEVYVRLYKEATSVFAMKDFTERTVNILVTLVTRIHVKMEGIVERQRSVTTFVTALQGCQELIVKSIQ